jgi:hypothetical protein
MEFSPFPGGPAAQRAPTPKGSRISRKAVHIAEGSRFCATRLATKGGGPARPPRREPR